MVGNFPAVLNINWLFLKLNRFICNELPVLPDHRLDVAHCKLVLEGKHMRSKAYDADTCMHGHIHTSIHLLALNSNGGGERVASCCRCWHLICGQAHLSNN